MKPLPPVQPPSAHLAIALTAVMKRRDADADGFMSNAELGVDQAAWSHVDVDKNGLVSAKELETAFQKADPDHLARFAIAVGRLRTGARLELASRALVIPVAMAVTLAVVAIGFPVVGLTLGLAAALGGLGAAEAAARCRTRGGAYDAREAELLAAPRPSGMRPASTTIGSQPPTSVLVLRGAIAGGVVGVVGVAIPVALSCVGWAALVASLPWILGGTAVIVAAGAAAGFASGTIYR